MTVCPSACGNGRGVKALFSLLARPTCKPPCVSIRDRESGCHIRGRLFCSFQHGCGVGAVVVRSRCRFFLSGSNSGCPIGSFLHHTPKLGIPVEMVVSFETSVEAEISCCAPRFSLILTTAKLHSLCVEESESDFSKGRRWSRIFYLRLHNPGFQE